MFAHHLARTVAHTIDVEGMLDSMTVEQLRAWWQCYRQEPWGNDWEQAGTIASTVHNEVGAVASALGASSQFKAQKPEYYIPRIVATKKKSNRMNPKQFLTQVRARFGV